jgi:hypothetical protein
MTRSVNDLDNQPVKTAFVNASSLGSNEIVAAVSGKVIRVLAASAVTTLANSVSFLTAAVAISAASPLAANGGFVLPHNPYGWFNTVAGEALNVNLSVATSTAVNITYIEV